MNPGDVPFLNFTPAFEEPALAFIQAVVAGYVCWEHHQQLPRSNLIFNQIGAKTMFSSTFSNSEVLLETRRLQHGVPTSHETIDCHAALLPVSGERCFALPVNFLTSAEAQTITGIASLPNTKGLVDLECSPAKDCAPIV